MVKTSKLAHLYFHFGTEVAAGQHYYQRFDNQTPNCTHNSTTQTSKLELDNDSLLSTVLPSSTNLNVYLHQHHNPWPYREEEQTIITCTCKCTGLLIVLLSAKLYGIRLYIKLHHCYYDKHVHTNSATNFNRSTYTYLGFNEYVHLHDQEQRFTAG